MRSRIGVIITAAGTAATLIATLSAAPSSATTATTWTVKPGGSFSGVGGEFLVRDTKTSGAFSCRKSSLAGTFRSGSELPGSNLGSAKSISTAGCFPPTASGLAFSKFPYVLSARSYSSGTTKGRITGIHAVGTGTGCYAVIDGTTATAHDGWVPWSYSNATGKLKIGPGGNLHAYKVSGCLGLVVSGDPLSPTDTFALSQKQTITSP
jgi:hypothetical protein